MLMVNPSRHRRGGLAWGDAELGNPGKGLGEGTNPSSYSPLPLLPPSGMSGVKQQVGGWAGGLTTFKACP